MQAIVMNRSGGPEALELVDRAIPEPGAGEVLVQVHVAGVNFMDIGVRRGLAWATSALPRTLGVEGAGRVLAVGDGVASIVPGQRVAWAYVPGSYASHVIAPEGALVPLPAELDDRTAAAVMLQGLTASHFATDFYRVGEGDIALVHAAAGGLGLLLTQIIRLNGGRVIGRVSSEDKVAAARSAGAEHVIVDAVGRFADDALRWSGGEGVHVVYDGSGPRTFNDSIASLRRSGTLCWYGPVLGGPGAIDLMSLPKSIKIGYAVFSDHVPTPERLRSRARRLFDWVAERRLSVTIGASFSLRDVARAHAAMESRSTTGKLLLLP